MTGTCSQPSGNWSAQCLPSRVGGFPDELTVRLGRLGAGLPDLLLQVTDDLVAGGRELDPSALAARVLELAGREPGGAELYLLHYHLLTAEPAVEPLFIHLADDLNRAARFIELWQRIRERWPVHLLQKLIEWCRLVAGQHPDYVNLLLEQTERLPCSRPALVDVWLEAGLPSLRHNFAAGSAYLRLESATSIQKLRDLQGSVDFCEVRRRFELYARAMAGFPIGFELQEAQEPLSGVCCFSGNRLYVRPSLDERDSRQGNLELYKLAVAHQLAIFEAGSGDFCWQASRDPLRDYLAAFADPDLAARLFRLVEGTRLDAFLMQCFAGLVPLVQLAWREARDKVKTAPTGSRQALMADLVRVSLGASPDSVASDSVEAALLLMKVTEGGAEVSATAELVDRLYPCFVQRPQVDGFDARPEETILHRGRLALDELALQAQLGSLEERIASQTEEDVTLSFALDPDRTRVEQVRKGAASGDDSEFVTELPSDVQPPEADDAEEGGVSQLHDLLQTQLPEGPQLREFFYDEWDHEIADYRPRWCRLVEKRLEDRGSEAVQIILRENSRLARDIKRQLQSVKPEMLRKVKARREGEELDLERVLDAIIDRRSGRTPDDRIYIQRQRTQRDIATLFLLDMSASTDEKLEDVPEWAMNGEDESGEEEEEELWRTLARREAAPARRIIDMEREAVVLMAEALEALGDSYAVCGFSGYGRSQVEFFVGKGFDEPWSAATQGRIASIQPCRSTRMGPAIRHAMNLLAATEARMQNLIIVSDGYPQDHDYGPDRNSRTYGIEDTARALVEVKRRGMQAFCLTVDPAGNDYLREMCPDRQYMVIQQLDQLPAELSRVYRSMAS